MNNIISFEIAKLLKQKNFDENCHYHYSYGDKDKNEPASGNVYQGGFLNSLGTNRTYKNSELSNWKLPYGEFSSPTIAQVVMWLYEKHEIWIEVVLSSDNNTVWWDYYISSLKRGALSEDDETEFKDPSKAYEAAIEYVLKNLI